MRQCYRFSFLFSVLLIAVSAYGQTSSTIRSKFRMLSVNGDISSLTLVGARETQTVQIPELRRSDVYQYEGAPVMRFVETDQIIEGEALPAPVLQVSDIDQHKNALILVFRSTSAQASAYKAVVMSDDVENFPGGTSRFVNISPYPLLVSFEAGSPAQRLPSGQILSHAFKSENQNVHIRIASYAQGEVHKALDDRIFPKAIHRDLYFIFEEQDGNVGRVKMRRLREHRNSAIRSYRSDG